MAAAIAVSGEEEASFTKYLTSYIFHGAAKANKFPLTRDIVSLEDYYQAFINSDAKVKQDYDTLLDYSREINNDLQAKKITEAERGFLISGVLIALQNASFQKKLQRSKD